MKYLTDIEHDIGSNAEVDLNSQKLEEILKAIGTFPVKQSRLL